MPVYVASRISGNDNMVFPDRIEIDDVTNDVTYYKGTLVGYRRTFIARGNIASVHIRSGLFFADVIIESTGGKEVWAGGFRKRDAREIMMRLS
ncbi:MAG: hypothetical protein IJT51_00900 [Bacteroidales bacterium]|nr:hypothetical protein [Bacteroidales bacterium]